MSNIKYAKSIVEDIIPVQPMDAPGGINIWSDKTFIYEEKPKILKIKDWLKKRKLEQFVSPGVYTKEFDSSVFTPSKAIASRYSEKPVNNAFFGLFVVGSEKEVAGSKIGEAKRHK